MKAKKLLSVVVAAMMLISCFGITSFAETTSSTVIKVEAEKGWTHNGIGVCERLGNADSNVIDSLGLRGNNGKNGSGATYKVNIPVPGKYSIKVFGTSLYNQWTWVIANGVKGSDKGAYVKTDGLSLADYGKKTEYLVVDLPVGEIDFTFVNGGSYNMVVDYYEFELIEEFYVEAVTTLNATEAQLGENATVSDDGKHVNLTKNGNVSWVVNNLISSGYYKFEANHYIGSGERFLVYVNDKLVNTTGYFTTYKVWTYATVAENIPLKNGDKITVLIDNSSVALKDLKLTKTSDEFLNATEAQLGENATVSADGKHIKLTKNGTLSWTLTDLPSKAYYKLNVNHYIGNGERYNVYVNGELINTTGYFNTTGVWVNETVAEDVLLKNGDEIKLLIDNQSVALKSLELIKTRYSDPNVITLKASKSTLGDNATLSADKTKVSITKNGFVSWVVNDLPSAGLYKFDVNHYIGCGERYKVYVNDELVKTTGYFTTTAKWVDETIAEDIVLKNGDTIKLLIDNQNVTLRTLTLTKTADVDTTVVLLPASKGMIDGNSQWSDENTKSHAILYSGASITWNVNNLFSSGAYSLDVTHYIGCGERYMIYVNDELITTTGYFSTTGSWVDETIVENVSLKNGDTIKLLIDNQMVNVRNLKLTKTGEYVAPDPNKALIDKLSNGGATIVVDTSESWLDNENVFAAVYYNGMLKNVYMGEVKGAETVTLNLDAINAADAKEKAKYTFKLFFWGDNMAPIPEDYYPTYEIVDSSDIYVSENGNDADNGSYARPVKTIEAAQALARNAVLNGEENVVVHIEGGEYTLTSPLCFTNDDNPDGTNVIYQGSPDGSTVINGGVKVEGWSDENNDGIYQASVNVSDLRQLWVNGNQAKRAQSDDMSAEAVYGENEGIVINNLSDAVTNEKDLEIVWDRGWTRQRFNVDEIIKEENTANFVLNRYNYALSETNSYIRPSYDYKFKIENAKYYLDEPGEFYFDKNYNILCYKPNVGENMKNAECYIGVSEGFMTIANAKNLTFKDLTFKHGTWLEPNEKGAYFIQDDLMLTEDRNGYTGGGRMKGQIEISSSDNIHFDNVNLFNIGSSGYSFIKGVTNSSIKNCDISGASAGAIVVGSFDKNYKICDNIEIKNNKISDIAFEYGGQSAIKAYYVANTDISSNTICDVSYSGISFGWGWSDGNAIVSGCVGNKITNNKISGYMKELLDGGAVYTLGKSISLNVSGNYINDTAERLSDASLASGLYADDGSENITFEGNVVENSKQWRHANTLAGSVKNINYNNNYYINSSEKQKVNIGQTVNGEAISTVYESGNVSLVEADENALAIINNAGAK